MPDYLDIKIHHGIGCRTQYPGTPAILPYAGAVEIADVERVAADLTGVTSRVESGLTVWRYHGRLVARQLDHTHVVIRSELDARPALLASAPQTFSVPLRFEKHMMVVADLEHADAAEVEHAFVAAWDLQQRAD